MKTFRIFANFDKEEVWLNKMAGRGQLLAKRGFFYSFVPAAPGNTTVRVDYRPPMSAGDFEDYRALFADAGWRHLAGSRSSGAQYFATSGSNSNADIFSDPWSKAQRYRRSITRIWTVLVPLLVFCFILFYPDRAGLEALFSPRDWYLTPDLWNKQGWSFVGAFLFETPFVLLRNAGPVLLVAAAVALLIQVVYQTVLYRKALPKNQA